MIVLPYFDAVTSWFGKRNAPKKGASSNHKGIDIAAPKDAPVCAAADGYISVMESQRGYGNVVYITHADGSQTIYGHLNKFVDIPVGTQVKAGQQIGFVGSTGVSTGNHLHFEYRDPSGTARNPQEVFGENLNQTLTGSTFLNNWSTTDALAQISQNTSTVSNEQDAQEKKERDQTAINDMLSFEYKKQALKTISESSNSSFFNLEEGGILGWTIKGIVELIKGDKKEEEEKETETVQSKRLNVSKTEMAEMGFTKEEISALSTLAKQQAIQKQSGGLNQTLSENGVALTSETLNQMGFSYETIAMLNKLYDQNNQQGQV